MNLIDVYIHEVTRRLPEKMRDDIALELRSTIEDMLPEDYTEEDVKVVLEKLGNPAVLASGYSERPMHLIGPRYFDIYVSLLKMIIPIAAIIAVISLTAELIIGYNEDEAVLNLAITILGKGIWLIIDVAMQVFFWLTLTFAIIERVEHEKEGSPLTLNLKRWKPDDLKNVMYIPKEKIISKGYVFGSLVWTTVWASFYFYADHLAGVYEGTENGLKFIMPALNQEVLMSFWPFVIVSIGLEVALALFQLIKKRWTKTLAFFNMIREIFGTIIVIIIINNSNIFNPDFLFYMENKIDFSASQINNFIVWLTIIIFPLFTIWNIFDGFRKAKS